MARYSFFRQDCLSEENLLRGKLKKLLLYRLILAVSFLLLTLAVTNSRKEDLFSSQLQPLYIFSCILFVFTIVGAWSIERARQLIRFAWVQLLFDTVAVTTLVHLSGGVESQFSFFYALVIISSALLLDRRSSLFTASACSLVYGILLDLQYFGWISPLQIVTGTGLARDSTVYFYHMLINITGFFLVAFIAGSLSRELRKSSRRVIEQEEHLQSLSTIHQSIVQSLPSGLLTIDTDGRIIFINNSGQDILGLKGLGIEGTLLSELLPDVEMPPMPGEENAHESARPLRMETVYRKPSGDEIHIGYSTSGLHSPSGEHSGWIFNFRDLTQLKAFEDQIKHNDRLVFAGRIASEIAHEIKNPLAAMSGAIQMLQDQTTDPFQERLLNIVKREISRINELVTDFLWMTKGSPKPARVEKVPVCSTIQEIISLLRSRKQLVETHVLRTEFDCSPLLEIDPHHLRQILWNLLTNGLEAMPHGGELCIRVGVLEAVDNSPSKIRLDIADTGNGLTEGVSQRIFDPFFTTKADGTGLGLSIVYQLVQKAGGSIETHPNPAGTGTEFSVFFPA